jgi:hypothetical protein
MVGLVTESRPQANPIDLLEELVLANDWAFDRASESEMVVEIKGRWCDYHLCVVWHQEAASMYVSCHLDVKVPGPRRRTVAELIAAANERLWLGHFDVASDDGMVSYRHTLPLRGTTGLAPEQLGDIVDCAVTESERVYPALQLVVWGGKNVKDALEAALMDTVGEA